MAMKPLAPGRLSTITGFPQASDSFSAISRMKMDGATPLECGIVIWTVRDGNGAIAGAPSTTSVQARRSRGISSYGTALARVYRMIHQPRWAEMCARILQQCEHLQGGRDRLARFLGVTPAELDEWLAARSGPPRAVFERAKELILAEHDRRTAPHAPGAPRLRPADPPAA